MIIYREVDTLKLTKPTACGLGNFDGVHLGHQILIKELVKQANQKKIDSTIITFEPHPHKLLAPEKADALLMTSKQKEEFIRSLRVDNLIFAPFTPEFAKMHYRDFIEEILIKKCNASIVVVGYDYRFGYRGEGNARILKELCQEKGVDTIIIPPVTYKGHIVSSTIIRTLIKNGDVEKAREYLGHLFSIEGCVVHGQAIGTKLGFPTANISFSPEIILPDFGVYAVLIKRDKTIYKAIANLGRRPTFNGSNVTLEVHIFDFNENIYGEILEILFVHRIRKEIKYDNPLDLKKQIKKDCVKAKSLLNDFNYDFTFYGVCDKIKN